MDERDKGAAPERDRTDASLREERNRTDRELHARDASREDDIDGLIQRARQRAQLVLDIARARADEEMDKSSNEIRTRVADERRAEDAARTSEHAAADARSRQEHSARRQGLIQHLAVERTETDRLLEEEREHANRKVAARDDVLGIVSHDLRTMLGTISLNAALIVSDASAGEVDRNVVRRGDAIQRLTARMSRVVDDLIEVVSIEAGKLDIEPRVSDVRSVLQDAVEAFAPTATARGVVLEAWIEGEDVRGRFDHERLLQVLGNLVSNALRFTPAGGRITLGGERTGPDLHIWVADTGAGIPADRLGTIFDRFQQVRRADRTSLGLGLYISRCIIEAHGGRIWVESELGSGSTFHIIVPGALLASGSNRDPGVRLEDMGNGTRS